MADNELTVKFGAQIEGLLAGVEEAKGAIEGFAAPITALQESLGGMAEAFAAAFAARSNLDWIGTVRGRVGWLLSPTLLVYGSGGFAYGGAKVSVAGALTQVPDVAGYSIAGPGSLAASGTAVGWTAGGGYGHSINGVGRNVAGFGVAYNFTNHIVGLYLGYDALWSKSQRQQNTVKGGITLNATIAPLTFLSSSLTNITATVGTGSMDTGAAIVDAIFALPDQPSGTLGLASAEW